MNNAEYCRLRRLPGRIERIRAKIARLESLTPGETNAEYLKCWRAQVYRLPRDRKKLAMFETILYGAPLLTGPSSDNMTRS